MRSDIANIALLITASVGITVLIGYLLNLLFLSWGHRYRAQVASQHQWQYEKYTSLPFSHRMIFHLSNHSEEMAAWELTAYQSGLNKVRLSWYSENRQFPEGLVVLYPRPGRIMKAVPRSLIPVMLHRVFGPGALPLTDHVVETPVGDEMLDELFFVFAAHRSLVPRLLTPTIRNLLVHWPAPRGYAQRPIVALFRRGLRLETVEPIPINDWLTTERLVGLGTTISHYINPFRDNGSNSPS